MTDSLAPSTPERSKRPSTPLRTVGVVVGVLAVLAFLTYQFVLHGSQRYRASLALHEARAATPPNLGQRTSESSGEAVDLLDAGHEPATGSVQVAVRPDLEANKVFIAAFERGQRRGWRFPDPVCPYATGDGFFVRGYRSRHGIPMQVTYSWNGPKHLLHTNVAVPGVWSGWSPSAENSASNDCPNPLLPAPEPRASPHSE